MKAINRVVQSAHIVYAVRPFLNNFLIKKHFCRTLARGLIVRKNAGLVSDFSPRQPTGLPNKSHISAVTILFVFLFLYSLAFAAADEKSDLELLQRAYPGAFELVPNGIRFPSGKIIIYNDGEKKDFAALLERPDLRDMLSLEYPAGEQKTPPSVNFDPGRFRNDDFFRALYGKDEKEIQSHLRLIQWMPSHNGPWLPVTCLFGVDKKLSAVIAELEALGPDYLEYLFPPGGTFNYRPIAGTGRLSAHSFGIAVDIAVAPSHYWQWETNGAANYKNSIPYAIVAVFEKYGFIWGGKWYHFDTMHFEYRPELLPGGLR